MRGNVLTCIFIIASPANSATQDVTMKLRSGRAISTLLVSDSGPQIYDANAHFALRSGERMVRYCLEVIEFDASTLNVFSRIGCQSHQAKRAGPMVM